MTVTVTIKGMVKKNDHATSVEAALSVVPTLNMLQWAVYYAVRLNPDICDTELEELPEFAKYSPSTIRKRRSELGQMGKLKIVGTKKNANGRKQNCYRVAGA